MFVRCQASAAVAGSPEYLASFQYITSVRMKFERRIWLIRPLEKQGGLFELTEFASGLGTGKTNMAAA